MEIWFYFWLVTFLLPFIVFLLLTVALRLTLDRKVRRSMPANKEYNCYLDSYGGVGRAITFGYACAFNYFNNSPRIRLNYENIDIQAIASPVEKLLGKLLTYCMICFAISLVITGILELFGFIDLSQ